MERGIPAVLIYEDLDHRSPYMHRADDVVGKSLNSPELLVGSARLAAAAVATLAGPLAEGSPPRFVRGDIDGDGKLTLADAIRALVYIFAASPGPVDCVKAMDFGDDGRVEMPDVLSLLFRIFTREAPDPVEPYPGCGVDLTVDPLPCGQSTRICRP